MCGRYFLSFKAISELVKRVDINEAQNLLLAKDYFPSNEVPIIILNNNRLNLIGAKWGFKAFDKKMIINARSETILEKSLFKNEVIDHRCIIPASGFYEWNELKQKFSFENENDYIMYLAGIYRMINGQIEMTIITTKANYSMQGIHHRMPLVLNEDLMNKWLRNKQFDNILNIVPPPLKITSGIIQTKLF